MASGTITVAIIVIKALFNPDHYGKHAVATVCFIG